MKPKLDLLSHLVLDVYRLDGSAPIPSELHAAPWTWISRTDVELSIVCPPNAALAASAEVSAGWSVLRVEGPIEHTVIGVLSKLSGVLATQRISIFALSTYDTDYVLIRQPQVDAAVRALTDAGYSVNT